MRNSVNIWVFVELIVFVRMSTGEEQTRECYCGYGGLCLKNYIGNIKTPCGQVCGTISGGFYDDCSIIVNHCASSPCLQGARCVSTWGSYFCDCPDEFYGQKCEIHSLNFKQFGVMAHQVYVYYQVQPRSDGTNAFHIIFNLLGDFKPRGFDDDYDDDVEVTRQAFGGMNLLLNVTLSDGRVFYPLRRKYMHKEIIKSRCFREVASNPELYDRRICDLLPNGKTFCGSPEVLFQNKNGAVLACGLSEPLGSGVTVFSFDATFYEGYYDRKLATRIELSDPKVSGVAGTVLVQAVLIDQDLRKHTVFNGSYKIFTYTKYRFPHSCERPITFRGCSPSKEEAGLHSRGSIVGITRLQGVGYCEGVLSMSGHWYIQENVELNTYGKYDPVPKLIESTDVPAKFTDDELIVYPRYLNPGLHMFMYAESLRGTPPHHGSRKEFSVYGRCWVRVIVQAPQFTTVGGIVQSVSCYHSLGVNIALKGRPSYSQFDIREFRINWHCNYTFDHECKPLDLPCKIGAVID